MCGISAWIWVRLIIFLAYGFRAYRLGLRVESVGKTGGIVLNNGDRLNFFWYSLFAAGFLTTWILLINGAQLFRGSLDSEGSGNCFDLSRWRGDWGSLMWQAISAEAPAADSWLLVAGAAGCQ